MCRSLIRVCRLEFSEKLIRCAAQLLKTPEYRLSKDKIQFVQFGAYLVSLGFEPRA